MRIPYVNGGIEVTLPENTRAEINASMVNERISTSIVMVAKKEYEKVK